MKLTKEQSREFIRSYSYWDNDAQELMEFEEEVEKQFVEKRRWFSTFIVILKCINTGKFYSFEEYEAATESQDTSDCYPDRIELVEVVPVKKMVEVTTWEEVKHE